MIVEIKDGFNIQEYVSNFGYSAVPHGIANVYGIVYDTNSTQLASKWALMGWLANMAETHVDVQDVMTCDYEICRLLSIHTGLDIIEQQVYAWRNQAFAEKKMDRLDSFSGRWNARHIAQFKHWMEEKQS